jgi:hypothetical protein
MGGKQNTTKVKKFNLGQRQILNKHAENRKLTALLKATPYIKIGLKTLLHITFSVIAHFRTNPYGHPI